MNFFYRAYLDKKEKKFDIHTHHSKFIGLHPRSPRAEWNRKYWHVQTLIKKRVAIMMHGRDGILHNYTFVPSDQVLKP
jgi:hypothetical protein